MSNQSLREAAQQALEAITAMKDQLLHDGVPTDHAHPRRIALVAGDVSSEALLAALAQPNDKAQAAAFVWPGSDGRMTAVLRKELPMGTELYATPQPPAEQPDKAQPVAWLTPELDRAVTEKTMAGARNDGGAILSSLRSYTVPAYAAPQPPAEQGAELSDYPPLPEPDGYIALTEAGSVVVPPREFGKHNAYAVFTAEQVRQAQRDAVAAERDALKVDAERLDFLDDLRKREAGTDIHIGNHYPVIYARTGIGSGIAFQGQGVTLRAAIDAAIRASKGDA